MIAWRLRLIRYTEDPLAQHTFAVDAPVSRTVASQLISKYAHHLWKNPDAVRIYDALKAMPPPRRGPIVEKFASADSVESGRSSSESPSSSFGWTLESPRTSNSGSVDA